MSLSTLEFKRIKYNTLWNNIPAGTLPTRRVLTIDGAVATNSTTYKTAPSSIYFPGSTGRISSPNSVDFRFGTGNFTVEWWMYLTTAWTSQNNPGICGQKQNDSSTGWQIYKNGTNSPTKVAIRLSGTNDFFSGSTPATTTWEHWAIVRNGSTLTWYKNGVSDATGSTSANTNDTAGLFYAGFTQTWGGYLAGCYIDDLRVSNIARYTDAFTPNTEPHIDDANTVFLLDAYGSTIVDRNI